MPSGSVNSIMKARWSFFFSRYTVQSIFTHNKLKQKEPVCFLFKVDHVLYLVYFPSRKSILEMKKDHEDQVRRLKKLKDEEIDAVTSATSQAR